jgi:hypothetical protein
MKTVDIKRFYAPRYCIDVPWNSIESTLASWGERKGLPKFLGLNLDPDFQRAHVWTEEKQVAYIEFCLREGEYSRTLLFNLPGWDADYAGEMVLVDGKQRLEAVRKFVRNELRVFGGNLLSDFDYPKRLLRSNGATLKFGVNNLKTRREVLEWYLQINTGGVVHTAEEIAKVEKMLAAEKTE